MAASRTSSATTSPSRAARTDDDKRLVPWETLQEPIRVRLAELELARNPPFTRYRLEELDAWEDIDTAIRWRPHAFDERPGPTGVLDDE